MFANPYHSPETKHIPSRRSIWRLIVGGGAYASGVGTALLALLQGIAGGRRLVIESQHGRGDTNPLFGIEFSLGQALVLGAVVAALTATVLFWIGYRVLRRRRND